MIEVNILVLISVIAANLCFGCCIGALTCALFQAMGRKRHIAYEFTPASERPVILEAVESILDSHGASVADFRDACRQRARSHAAPPRQREWDTTVERVRSANAAIEQELAHQSARIIKLPIDCQAELQQVMQRLCEHRGHVRQLDNQIPDQGAVDIAAPQLETVIAELLDSKHRLQRELHEARERILHQEERLKEVEEEARFDVVTKLPNRRDFEEKLAEIHQRHRDSDLSYGCAVLDINHFKSINDTHGHAAGDAVLAALAKVICEAVRGNDYVARIGGDEFVILLPGITSHPARQIIDRCRQKVRRTVVRHGNEELRFSISLGLEVIRPGESAQQLFERADMALYDDKKDRESIEPNAIPSGELDEIIESAASEELHVVPQPVR